MRLDFEGRERCGGKGSVADREKGDGQLLERRPFQVVFRRLRW